MQWQTGNRLPFNQKGHDFRFYHFKKDAISDYFPNSLRCSFLHSGNTGIKDWDTSEDEEFYTAYEFRLTIGGADSAGSSWPYQPHNDVKVQKTRIVSINIDKLCQSLCQAAEHYYQEKDVALFKEHHIHLINLE